MRAVNLLPADLRGARGAGGGSGNGVYVLLGVLALALVLVSVYTLTAKSVTDKKNDLTEVTAKAEATEARAGQLEPYTKFAELRAKRVETVTSLSRSRFNWPYALREVSRVLPSNVWLTDLLGTVAPGVTVEGSGSGATSGLRSALGVPALELSGCTVDQESVARYLARLRSIDGVTRVSLASSEKNDSVTAGGGGGANDGDCRQGLDRIPKFEAVVFFERSTATAASPAGGSQPAGIGEKPGGANAAKGGASGGSSSTASSTPSSSTPTSGTAPSTGSTK